MITLSTSSWRLSLLLIVIGTPFWDPFAASCKPEDWAQAIKKIETRLQAENPPEGSSLFVGSSSIRLWDLKRDFPEVEAVNCGFGGSEIEDSLFYMDRIVIPLRPKVVVFYAGDNDIAGGKSAERVHSDFKAFAERLHEKLPETRLIYIAIKPSIARWNWVGEMRKANDLIRKQAESVEGMTFLDIDSPMIGEDGKPRKELFLEDGLHLNAEGYRLWSEVLRPHLSGGEEKR